MAKLVLVLAALVAVCAVANAQSELRSPTKYTVLAKTMTTAKLVTNLVPPPPPIRDDDNDDEPPLEDEEPVAPKKPRAAVKAVAKGKAKGKAKAKAVAKKAGAAKAAAKKAEAKGKAKTAKTAKKQEKSKAKKEAKKQAKKKLQPGQASLAVAAKIKAAKKQAPKDQLMRWIRKNAVGASEDALQKIDVYLTGQMIHTFEDLLAKGEDGIKALLVGPEWREKFMDLLLAHIGKTRGVDDGMLVPTEALKKGYNPRDPKPKKTCKHGDARQPVPPPTARFAAIPVNAAAPSPVGDWLRRAFPEAKPLRLSRAILALERQNIRTFTDLRRVGVKGVKRLLYVPDGVRAALYEAILYHIGTEGYDDGKPVTALPYVAPKAAPKGDCH